MAQDRLSQLIAAGRSGRSAVYLMVEDLDISAEEWVAILKAAEKGIEVHGNAAVDTDATTGFYYAAGAIENATAMLEQAIEDEGSEAEVVETPFGIRYARDERRPQPVMFPHDGDDRGPQAVMFLHNGDDL